MSNKYSMVNLLISNCFSEMEEKELLQSRNLNQNNKIIKLLIEKISTFDEKKKNDTINMLNLNFSTVLSYGDDNEMVPVGEFKVSAIQFDKTKECKCSESHKIILEKQGDNSAKIEMPLAAFILLHESFALKNSEILKIDANPYKDLRTINKEAIDTFNKNPENLLKANMVSLESAMASVILNNNEGGLNYSLCPVDLGVCLVPDNDAKNKYGKYDDGICI